MKFLLIFSFLLLTPLICSAEVVINEIAWMGTTENWRYEWFELYDVNGSVSLDGWKIELYRDNLDFTIELTGTIEDYFLIVASDKIFADYDFNYSNLGGKLNNGGQKVVLKNNQGNIIDEIDCFFEEKWLAGDNDTKQTMERIADGWQTGSSPGGTPGAQNSSGANEEPEEDEEETDSSAEETEIPAADTYMPIPDAGNDIIGFVGQEIEFNGLNSSDPNGYELAYSWNMGNGELIEKDTFNYVFNYPGTYLVTLMVYNGREYNWDTITVEIQTQEICINEFLPNPEGKDEQGEWIEIYNDSNSIVDISDWQLDDEEEGSKPFIFPKHTLIAPKTYLVFDRKITKIALNNDKDSVRLLLPQGIVFQEIIYENPKQGQSSARIEDEFVWAIPTPGMINILEAIGGTDREVVYQYEVEKQETKESEYAVEYNNPEQNIENEYIAQEPSFSNPLAREIDGQLAMVPSSDKIAKIINNKDFSENNFKTQNSFSLILIIIAVILSALIFGILITRFTKKST